MIFLPLLAVVGSSLTSAASTSLFISGVTLGTSTYIGVKKTQKK